MTTSTALTQTARPSARSITGAGSSQISSAVSPATAAQPPTTIHARSPTPSASRRALCRSHAKLHVLSTNASAPASRASSSGHGQGDGLCQPPANIATPSEIVVATSFTLEVGDTTGTIHFCIPYSTLEPIRDVLYSTIQGDSNEPDRRWVNLMKQQIQAAEVEVVAELATAPATVEQLLAFKPGDFIELDLEKAIQAKVSGVPVFDCHYGTSNGKYALKVEQLLTGSNMTWLGESHV